MCERDKNCAQPADAQTAHARIREMLFADCLCSNAHPARKNVLVRAVSVRTLADVCVHEGELANNFIFQCRAVPPSDSLDAIIHSQHFFG